MSLTLVNDQPEVIGSAPRAWCFQLNGGDGVYSLPLIGSLPVADAIKLQAAANSGSDVESMQCFVGVVERYCPELLEHVTLEQLGDVLDGWQRASHITAGESQGSSD